MNLLRKSIKFNQMKNFMKSIYFLKKIKRKTKELVERDNL